MNLHPVSNFSKNREGRELSRGVNHTRNYLFPSTRCEAGFRYLGSEVLGAGTDPPRLQVGDLTQSRAGQGLAGPRPGRPIQFQCRGRRARSSGGGAGEGGPRGGAHVTGAGLAARQVSVWGKGVFGPSRRSPGPLELPGSAALADQSVPP